MCIGDYVQIIKPKEHIFHLKYGQITTSDAGVLYLIQFESTQIEKTHSWFHESHLKVVTKSEYLASFVFES